MKLLLLLALVFSLAMALDFSELDARQRHHRTQKTSWPKKFDGVSAMRAASRPRGAPPDYKTSTDRTTKRSQANLEKLPADLIDRAGRSAGPACRHCVCSVARPRQQTLPGAELGRDARGRRQLAPRARVPQLSMLLLLAVRDAGDHDRRCGQPAGSAEALCVADGNTGTLVGEDAPQWDAGLLNLATACPAMMFVRRDGTPKHLSTLLDIGSRWRWPSDFSVLISLYPGFGVNA